MRRASFIGRWQPLHNEEPAVDLTIDTSQVTIEEAADVVEQLLWGSCASSEEES